MGEESRPKDPQIIVTKFLNNLVRKRSHEKGEASKPEYEQIIHYVVFVRLLTKLYTYQYYI